MSDPLLTSQPTADLPAPSGTIRAVHLEVVTGPDAGKELRVASERIVIGTHRHADFVLTDRTVSRFHLELVMTGESVSLRDLGSSNGTLLDGVELEHGRFVAPRSSSSARPSCESTSTATRDRSRSRHKNSSAP